jgi:soluble lytic murein transglycosylase-like protein
MAGPKTHREGGMKAALAMLLYTCGALFSPQIFAGNQAEEKLSASVVAALSRAVSDRAAPRLMIENPNEGERWINDMSGRLPKDKPQVESPREFLTTVHYEASRAGLDPQLVLSVIQVESAFRKYATSIVGAQGYMQVMPFWVKLIGAPNEHNLYHLRTNLRYGCIILRHYLDRENGDIARALARYNGSLGRTEYSDLVLNTLRNRWSYSNSTLVELPR